MIMITEMKMKGEKKRKRKENRGIDGYEVDETPPRIMGRVPPCQETRLSLGVYPFMF